MSDKGYYCCPRDRSQDPDSCKGSISKPRCESSPNNCQWSPSSCPAPKPKPPAPKGSCVDAGVGYPDCAKAANQSEAACAALQGKCVWCKTADQICTTGKDCCTPLRCVKGVCAAPKPPVPGQGPKYTCMGGGMCVAQQISDCSDYKYPKSCYNTQAECQDKCKVPSQGPSYICSPGLGCHLDSRAPGTGKDGTRYSDMDKCNAACKSSPSPSSKGLSTAAKVALGITIAALLAVVIFLIYSEMQNKK